MALLSTVATILALGALSQTPPPAADAPAVTPPPSHWEGALYVAEPADPVLQDLEKAAKAQRKALADSREEVQKADAAEKQRERDNPKVLMGSLPADQIPGSPEEFGAPFFFPPVAQYLTGTCWSFAGTSFLESEARRLSGNKVKLSEMHTVYWEYVEKARRFVQQRGFSNVDEGSQGDGVTRILAQYGAMPLEAYPGVLAEDGRHNHANMVRELKAYLRFVKSNDLWDEQLVLEGVRGILDRYLGAPPKDFRYGGKKWTPLEFMRKKLKVDPAAYVVLTSTTAQPFWKLGAYEVPDNWRKAKDYLNVPLEDFYAVLKGATEAGLTAVYGGDVSEPGKNAREDVAFIPEFDIPSEAIDQDAREYRIFSGLTTDDHGVHILGRLALGDHEWYLIKDSGRSARKGKHLGFYFFRDDFMKLKMLTLLVHRDALCGRWADKAPELCQAPEGPAGSRKGR
jgi:bleomycin hydrolase